MTDSRFRERTVNEDHLCDLLQVSRRQLDALERRKGLPPAAGNGPSGRFWAASEIRRWLADTGHRPPSSLRLRWWPDATEPAVFAGSRLMSDGYVTEQTTDVVQWWETSHGSRIAVRWRLLNWAHARPDYSRMAPDADIYLTIGLGWSFEGPDVWERSADTPQDEHETDWQELARVLGRPAPFWPDAVRDPELIHEWRPGVAAEQTLAHVPVDVDALLRMSALYPVGHPVQTTMHGYARVILSRESDVVDRNLLDRAIESGALTSDMITLAATRIDAPSASIQDIPETTRRIGWREVLDRADRLAEKCVRAVMEWNGGADLPHSYMVEIDRTGAGKEFLARLIPAPRRAAFAVLDRRRECTPMIDPLTDTPVAVPADPDGRICALAPRRLPTTSPLAALVLDDPIWIRTQDGNLFPAPYDHAYGLSWGYSGTGPVTLAKLITSLLRDITSYGAQPPTDVAPPSALLELLTQPWPHGTVITRAQLDDATRR